MHSRCEPYTMRCVALVLLLLTVIVPVSWGQATGSVLDLDRASMLRQNTTLGALLSAEPIPTDDAVDPTVYRVGPGDVLSYQTTGLDFSEKMVMVTPENTLLLERYGMISVAGQTLEEVRSAIIQRVQQQAPGIEIFVTLRKPRLVYVTLKGNVTFPGTYAVPASMRVSTLLAVTRQPWLLRRDGSPSDDLRRMGASTAFQAATNELARAVRPDLTPYAMRNIVIRHRQGVSLVDLALSSLPGGARFDPHLREGDVVTVPFDSEEVPTISVSGAVVSPITLAYKVGDRASLLLAVAGGPLQDADLDRVLLVQSSGGGAQTLVVDSTLTIEGADVPLEPGASIIVERRAYAGEPMRQGVVEVYGEVARPGTVVIEPGVTRLAEAVRLAGGPDANASLALSYVVRPEMTVPSERELEDRGNRRFMYSDLTLEDTLRYRMDQMYRLPFVSCNVEAALRDTAGSNNITLQHGDIIVIEDTPSRVYVYGQVHRPGFVTFSPGKTLRWYVERAGGFGTGAETSRARVIKGRSNVWVEDRDAIVEPGDEIYVPRPPDIPASVEIQTYAAVAAIASAIALLATTFITIFR